MKTIELDASRLYGFRILPQQKLDSQVVLGSKVGGKTVKPSPVASARLGSKIGGKVAPLRD